MGAVRSNLHLTDGMTSVLRKINSALLTCLDSFDNLQTTSGNSIDSNNIVQARSQLIGVTRELEEIASAQHDVNDSLSQGVTKSESLLGKITKIAGAYVNVRSAVNFTKDAIAGFEERANVNTQLATSLKNTGLGQDAYDQLTAAANNYGMYTSEALTGAAAEFATYMSDSDAIETMMGTLTNYAAGMSGGGALDTQQIVNYATQLGKVLNGTFDGIAQKGFTVTDAQKKILKTGTDMEKAAVVADIINESWAGLYENMANTPEGKIITLQNSIDALKADVGGALLPAVLSLVSAVQNNLPAVKTVFDAIGSAINSIIPILTSLINLAAAVVTFFAENWSWIEPIIWGIVGALIAYEAITKVVTIVTALLSVAEGIKGAAQMRATKATMKAKVEQYGLNAALLANPITWIIVLIVAVIAVIWQWVKSVGGLKNAWEICKAALMVAWNALKVAWYATVYGFTWGINKVLDFIDTLKLGWQIAGTAIADFIGDMKVNVLTILQNMINSAIDIINGFIGVLNMIPGVNIGLVEKVTFAATAAAENEAAKQARKEELKKYKDDLAAGKAAREANLQNMKNNLDNSVAELQDSAKELADLYAASRASASESETAAAGNIEKILTGDGGLGEIADNTAGLKKSTEDLKYMRDLAEKEAINRFTTAEVKIDMSGMTNKIDSSVDIDGFIAALTDGFSESLEVAAEGVHA